MALNEGYCVRRNFRSLFWIMSSFQFVWSIFFICNNGSDIYGFQKLTFIPYEGFLCLNHLFSTEANVECKNFYGCVFAFCVRMKTSSVLFPIIKYSNRSWYFSGCNKSFLIPFVHYQKWVIVDNTLGMFS